MWRMMLLGLMLAWRTAGYAADPLLDYVYPAGGRPGAEFEIEVGGRSLQELTSAVFTGSGVKATAIGPVRTITYSKKGKPVVTPLTNRYRFKVVIEKDAAPGARALRVNTAYRVSDPVGFELADMPELSEPATNRLEKSEAAVDALPVCLNGRVHGAEGDRYRFRAAKGATLVALTEPHSQPFGGFKPLLTFTDESGKECPGVTTYGAADAPAAVFEVPQDGVYLLSVKAPPLLAGDAAVYRVKLGELPLITGFSPPGAKEGESLNVKLAGHNLPQKRVRLFTGGKNSALCLETLKEGAFVVPGLRFDLSPDADESEKEPNDTAETAQPIAAGCVINGVLEAPGGRDRYRFAAKAGSVICVDAYAASLGSPLKPRLTVFNAGGGSAVVAQVFYGTNATRWTALQSRDPSVELKPSADGEYEVELSDASGRGGDDFAYRLRVGPPQPDFNVWMTPSSLNIPADGSALVTVYVQRLHGFSGEVRVALDYPPLSIACEGGVIPAGASFCKMTVSTDGARYPRTVFGLSLTATAEIDGRPVKRAAMPVRFEPSGKESRVFGELSARASPGLRALRLDVPPKTPVTIPLDAPAQMIVLSPNLATYLGGLYEPVVVWPPHGFTVQGVQRTNKQERASILLKANPKAMRPGATGQLILGCVQKDDAEKTVMAVTQSVPFLIK